jgi:hypothetical protein
VDTGIPLALCFADLNGIKSAALFYDNVLPFPFEAVEACDRRIVSSRRFTETVVQFIPERTFLELLGPIYPIMAEPGAYGMDGQRFAATVKALLVLGQANALGALEGHPAIEDRESGLLDQFRRLSFEPIVVMPEWALRDPVAGPDDISLAICNASLIDTSRASWEQILEVRHDKLARQKLRNLRMFLRNNYTNKSRSYIEDDLSKRLDDYENVAKDHGFDTAISVLTMITSSKNLATFGAGSLAAALIGQPVVASASLATGITAEVARVVIEIVNGRHAFQKFTRDHPMAYVLDVRSRLGLTRSDS